MRWMCLRVEYNDFEGAFSWPFFSVQLSKKKVEKKKLTFIIFDVNYLKFANLYMIRDYNYRY